MVIRRGHNRRRWPSKSRLGVRCDGLHFVSSFLLGFLLGIGSGVFHVLLVWPASLFVFLFEGCFEVDEAFGAPGGRLNRFVGHFEHGRPQVRLSTHLKLSILVRNKHELLGLLVGCGLRIRIVLPLGEDRQPAVRLSVQVHV